MLKASYEVLQPAASQSFLLKIFGELAFTAPYHFHPEYELTLITGGRGKRYVGNHMADFETGDLVLIGPHLPHCWKLDLTQPIPAGAIVIQFSQDFLGNDFFSKTELGPIRQLLQKSVCGLQFGSDELSRYEGDAGGSDGGNAEGVLAGGGRVGRSDGGNAGDGRAGGSMSAAEVRIRGLAAEKNDFRRLLVLLEILQALALSRNSVPLDTRPITAELPPVDRERIHPIFAHLVENFRGEISLASAAAVIGMTPNAFCRYFKKITRKTYMETVIEYRLNYATQQLVQTGKPISAICFDSGFSDISHFYKMFRSRMRMSPLHYRKKFMLETTGN